MQAAGQGAGREAQADHGGQEQPLHIAMPASYAAARVGAALLVALPDMLAAARAAIEAAGSLHAWAAGRSDAARLEGRGPAYVVPLGGRRCVVRHYRRGGLVAKLLGDRYLRVGEPRPLRELAAAAAARARGVESPHVVAAAVHPAGAFYLADLVTEYVPASADLARVLFGDAAADRAERLLACAAAGRLLRALPAHGVVHADLNLKNVLIDRASHPPRALLLDLDRCRVVDRVPAWQAARMRRRFRRSLEKWQALAGRRLEADERAALETGAAPDG